MGLLTPRRGFDSLSAHMKKYVPGLLFPEPTDKAFVGKVRIELAEARRRACEVMPLPVTTYTRSGSRGKIVRHNGYKSCVGCGCALDAKTPGCKTCKRRHEYRAWMARRRALATDTEGC